MKPVSPVIEGLQHEEVIIAKDQPQYLPLPALPVNYGEIIITRWRMTWRERLAVFLGGDIFLLIWRFQNPLQPVKLEVNAPKVDKLLNLE